MDNLIGTKEDGGLVFMREFDGKLKTIKYDFATGGFFSQTKKGNWRSVESVHSFFRNCSIKRVLNSFEDEGYKTFLNRVYDKVLQNQSRRYSNIGSVLAYISKYQYLESYSVLGIKVEGVSKPISAFPKDFINYIREADLTVTYEWENLFYPHGYDQEKGLVVKKITWDTIRHIINEYHMDLEVYEQFNKLVCNSWRYAHYHNSIVRYGLEYKSFFNYLVKLYRTEALNFDESLNLYSDYMNMARQLRDERADKYPVNLRLRHDITAKNYRVHKTYVDEAKFKSAVNYSYDWTNNKFAVVAPIDSNEVKEEGNKLSHCVASYIRKIIDGYCQILFFRDLEDGNNPLLTLEIRENTIVQVRGQSNRLPSDAENEILKKFAKAKNLNYLDVQRVVEAEGGED